MDDSVDRIKKWFRGEKQSPFSMKLAISEVCNIKCKLCIRWPFDYDKKELSKEELFRIVQQAGKLGVRQISIAGGGEPFAYADKTMAVIREIRKNNMNGGLTTNGSLITEKIAKELVEIEWGSISFSIDSLNEEKHDFIRGKGVFKRSMKAIGYINNYKKKYKKPFLNMEVTPVLTNKNYDQILDYVEFCEQINADNLVFQSLITSSDESKDLALSDKQMRYVENNIEKAIELCKKYKIRNNLDDFRKRDFIENSNEVDKVFSEDFICFEPWSSLSIHANGAIDPCEHNNHSSFIQGRDLKEVWFNDDHLNKMRESFKKGIIPKFCSMCCTPEASRNIKLFQEIKKEAKEKIKVKE